MGSVNRDDDADLLHTFCGLHLDDPASRQTTVTLHRHTPSPPDTPETDPALEEALRRSRCETTLEESLLADALAASITTRDEELALALQREQLALHEHELRRTPRRHASSSSASTSASASASASAPASASASAHTSTPTVDPAPANPVQRRPPIIRISRRRSVGPSAASSAAAASSASAAGSASVSLPPPLGQLSAAEPVLSQSRPANQSTGSGLNNNKQAPFGSGTTSVLSPITPSPAGSYYSSDGCLPGVPPVIHPFTFGTSSSFRDKDTVFNTAANTTHVYRDDDETPTTVGASISTVLGMSFDTEIEAPSVVVDGQNVGCAYDINGRFRSRGVQAVLNYYARQGVRAVALLPQAKVDERGGVYADRVADDPALLKGLAISGRVAFTPAGSHDDHFLLQYAMSRGLDLISNDRFQKEIVMQETTERAHALRFFLREHLIPYTFVQGEFIPHPNPTRLGDVDHASRKR